MLFSECNHILKSVRLVVLCVFVVMLLGCPRRQQKNDTWKHYVSGGHFIGGPPTMSRDGAFVIYASPRSGHGDIYRTNIANNSTTRLTMSNTFESYPVISPDGKWVAFLREINGDTQIWIVGTDGNNEQILTDSVGYSDVRPVFSEDSKKLVFFRSHSWHSESTSDNSEGFFEIHIDGTRLRRLTESKGKLSPQGDLQVYNIPDPSTRRPRVFVAKHDGTEERLLGNGMSPSFSENGKQIVCLSNDYTNQLIVMRVDGSENKKVNAPQGHKSEPIFCLNDTHILVRIDTNANDRGDGPIYLINIEDGIHRKIVETKSQTSN